MSNDPSGVSAGALPGPQPHLQGVEGQVSAQALRQLPADDGDGRQFRPDVRLDEIAQAAGVSVGTVLRIFGSRQLLLDEVAALALRDVEAEFADVQPGDLRGVVRAYFNHYEKTGDLVVRNIVDEADPEMHRFVEHGRAAHRAGVESRLAPALAGTSGVTHRRAVDALVCALDVYTWKLLRRDIGRSRADAEATVHRMVVAIVEGLS